MTQKEFDEGYDGLHVPLTCENHPHLIWSCKRIALSKDVNGVWRYNGSRHLFYTSDDQKECDCPVDKLRAKIEPVLTPSPIPPRRVPRP